MSDGRTPLDREGCEFGRGLAKDVGSLREDMGEVKQDVKKLIISVARIEQAVQLSRPSKGGRGNNKEFWASLVALAIAIVTLATTWVKVWVR